MLLKTGRIFRNGTGERAARLVYARAIGTALRNELGSRASAYEKIHQWTGVGERTIRNWLKGTRGPRGEHLLLLALYSDEVFGAVLSLTARDRAVAPTQLRKICDEMARSLRNFEELMEQPR
jgi:hypothetical protein